MPSTSQPDPRVFETTTGPHTLEEIDAVLRQVWSDDSRIPFAVRMQVEIAVGEIGANIVEHACRSQAVWMRMEVAVSAHEVCIEFSDAGIPAHVNLAAVHLPDEMAERGRGLALAQSALGTLCYRRNTVNHWTLISKRFD